MIISCYQVDSDVLFRTLSNSSNWGCWSFLEPTSSSVVNAKFRASKPSLGKLSRKVLTLCWRFSLSLISSGFPEKAKQCSSTKRWSSRSRQRRETVVWILCSFSIKWSAGMPASIVLTMRWSLADITRERGRSSIVTSSSVSVGVSVTSVLRFVWMGWLKRVLAKAADTEVENIARDRLLFVSMHLGLGSGPLRPIILFLGKEEGLGRAVSLIRMRGAQTSHPEWE